MGQSVWHITQWELVLRLIMAAAVGGLIGIERERNNHAAGFRTHILVCLGSAMIMLLSIYGFAEFAAEPNVRMDPARLAAQVVSGIGFLGAGAILRNGNVIKGLTTAASVWVVAALGLCVGAGFYTGALVCTLLALISLHLLNKWEKTWGKERRNRELDIELIDYAGVLAELHAALREKGIHIVNMRIVPGKAASRPAGEAPAIAVKLVLRVKSPDKLLAAIEEISKWEHVVSVQSEQLP
ncbi:MULTISPECIES: MgtC/SapB family protein [unclassified Paenibacillus]|uniref:MgtC/SapB family protein n=1 Tax=unclassified Paenibacillus TaxID=185978 RepID=UPI001C0F6797|nr:MULTISPECIES: MgtC/SapB family protein [unclassified Paenibacillus]MBU5441703.1 MgtC/SapB family protein [Paenibacillus sp. MSJ-34]CAH0118105.1 Protein SapB [Paenibacillus sp. CECT 9249]